MQIKIKINENKPTTLVNNNNQLYGNIPGISVAGRKVLNRQKLAALSA